jgi:hypothetical protein
MMGRQFGARRAAWAICLALIAGALTCTSWAAAAGCPTATYLNYDHLAYAAVTAPPRVALVRGAEVGTGAIDEPTSADGCKRRRVSVQVRALGSLDAHVVVLAGGRPRTAFVIGQRCAGFTGPAYWGCLLHPLVFRGRQYTATSYPRASGPPRSLALGGTLGSARYGGAPVRLRLIDGVAPSLAVAIAGRPSVALLSPETCPYGGFSDDPRYDNLLRCLHSPVWFTFDPPGNEAGAKILARSDRPLSAALAGASISLVQLPLQADFVPSHGRLVAIGKVSGPQLSFTVPDVPPGLYEAVVACPRCAPAPGGILYPAGSILVAAKPQTSVGITIVSYVLGAAVLAAVFLAYMTRRRRHGPGAGSGLGALGRMMGAVLIGPGPAGSSRRGRSWTEDAAARPPARGGPGRAASPRAKPAAPAGRGAPRGKNAGRRGRKRGGG